MRPSMMTSCLAITCVFLAGLSTTGCYVIQNNRASNLESKPSVASRVLTARDVAETKALSAPTTPIEPVCRASGYCSLESNPSHYIGPVRSNLELKAALTALAFKKEIILTTESRLDPAAQFVSNFQKAGYGHLLVMTDSDAVCKHLAPVFEQLGCGWCPAPALYDEALSGMFPLNSQYPKLFMGARIIRHGYNVMMVDSGEAQHTP